MTDLLGKVALVTGATSGIGLAAATFLAESGAAVCLAARSRDKGIEIVTALNEAGLAATFCTTDVTSEADVAAMIDHTLTTFGRLDFAFNNAGIFEVEQPLHAHQTDTFDRVVSVNLRSVYLCMKHEIAAMLNDADEDTHRAIINNASIIGHRGSEASGFAYTTAKHGVLGMTRQAAVAYAATSIRVNAVSPGPTLTEATRPRLALPEEALRARISALNPTGRMVPAEDIAATVGFLCTPAASMINGQDIVLDGGQLAKL